MTETEAELLLGTQMLVPSKTGDTGKIPTVTVWRMAPLESSFRRVRAVGSVIQTLAPSKRAVSGLEKPTVTVVTVHGAAGLGVTIETDPPGSPLLKFGVQNRAPSNAGWSG